MGNLVFDQAEGRPLSDDVRNRIAARATVLRLDTIKPHFGSLERDPIHPSAYYLAVDGVQREPLLLYLASATAPTSSIFYKPLLIGRGRRVNGPEMVINAVPFGPASQENLRKFAIQINTAFLPRPQGSRTAIAIGASYPEACLPAAFEAFRAIQKRTGRNLAALCVAPGAAPAREVYHTGLWAAIRAGWRDGYSAGADITVGESLDSAREAIRYAAGFSFFSVDPARLFHPEADPRHPSAWSDTAVTEVFERAFTADERGWILAEFARAFDLAGTIYEFSHHDVLRMAVQFGEGLKAADQLHEAIRQARATQKTARSFDFDLVLNGGGTCTTPQGLLFCLHWLKARGHAAQLAEPDPGEPGDLARNLADLAAVARHYQCTLSVRGREEYDSGMLELIARATAGRVHYKVLGELALREGYLDFLAGHLVG